MGKSISARAQKGADNLVLGGGRRSWLWSFFGPVPPARSLSGEIRLC